MSPRDAQSGGKAVIGRLERFTVITRREVELIDITPQVLAVVESMVYVLSLHTTTGLTVNEGLPDLERDIVDLLRRLVPEDLPYRHARFLHGDGRMAINAPSHPRGALLGFRVFFPVEDGRVVKGSRQTIYLAELDGPQRAHLGGPNDGCGFDRQAGGPDPGPGHEHGRGRVGGPLPGGAAGGLVGRGRDLRHLRGRHDRGGGLSVHPGERRDPADGPLRPAGQRGALRRLHSALHRSGARGDAGAGPAAARLRPLRDRSSGSRGEDLLQAPSYLLGVRGMVSGLCNVDLRPYVQALRAARRNGREGVLAGQRGINALFHIILAAGGQRIPAIKAAMELLGRGRRHMRLAGLTLNGAEVEAVRRELSALGLL